ncbi:MAG: N-acylglucosamine 2-epimerase [Candidatus Hydrogenedens sp.]|jgi:mannobiose 2-epimerase|nr:N-acylglucosamine 2-epimerase [Candidatus Hydrogenedens sp.]
MSLKDRVQKAHQEIKHHLFEELLPFWTTRGVDKEYGGYLTYLDKNGDPTGEDIKTLVCQTRMIYTFSSIHRAGLDKDGVFLPLAKQGVEFLLKHFKDEENGGWFWTSERDGTPRDRAKIMYGHSFAVYSLSEYALAAKDPAVLQHAVDAYDIIKTRSADLQYGGFGEFFEEDWSPKQPGVYGGDRKSLDVHMHLMEAFTNLYEATGNHRHKRDTERVIDLIFERMIHPEFGTGIAQFAFDWTPLRAILFRNVWGSDRDVEDDEGRPINNTSFGHNVEFAWLLMHSLRILGLDVAPFREGMKKLYDHCHQYGIDWERGGVYCEGPSDGPARERNKEFWQQAETLVGMLDAFLLLEDEKYWDAYENVHRFVMDHVINHEVGEWYPLFDENNNRLWDYMGHAWKINYHTVRAAIQSEQRLSAILKKLES